VGSGERFMGAGIGDSDSWQRSPDRTEGEAQAGGCSRPVTRALNPSHQYFSPQTCSVANTNCMDCLLYSLTHSLKDKRLVAVTVLLL
jgi:hypothetical protein